MSINCPFYIQGRIDATCMNSLREQTSNEDLKDYLSYSSGFASYKAIVDFNEQVKTNVCNWPLEAQQEYEQNYSSLMKDEIV